MIELVKKRELRTIEGFGREWITFDQSPRSVDELRHTFDAYFRIFPLDSLPPDSVGLDLGCGSGRWARFASESASSLVCVDASREALQVAKTNLRSLSSCFLARGVAGALPLKEASLDFAYCLGVLHHLEDPRAALEDCVRKLKEGAPLLVYVYYALDNRPGWYRLVWRTADLGRRLVSRMPFRLRLAIASVAAATLYYPLARVAGLLQRSGFDAGAVPLAAYADRSFYAMRTDALDRFGTRVEHRFTSQQLVSFLEAGGLTSVSVSSEPPYWCAVGYRSQGPR